MFWFLLDGLEEMKRKLCDEAHLVYSSGKPVGGTQLIHGIRYELAKWAARSQQQQQQQPFLSGFTSLGHQHFFWLQASSTKPINGNRWKWRTTASLPVTGGNESLVGPIPHSTKNTKEREGKGREGSSSSFSHTSTYCSRSSTTHLPTR
ncbi:unnamed protein product [Prunus brigantina]